MRTTGQPSRASRALAVDAAVAAGNRYAVLDYQHHLMSLR